MIIMPVGVERSNFIPFPPFSTLLERQGEKESWHGFMLLRSVTCFRFCKGKGILTRVGRGMHLQIWTGCGEWLGERSYISRGGRNNAWMRDMDTRFYAQMHL